MNSTWSGKPPSTKILIDNARVAQSRAPMWSCANVVARTIMSARMLGRRWGAERTDWQQRAIRFRVCAFIKSMRVGIKSCRGTPRRSLSAPCYLTDLHSASLRTRSASIEIAELECPTKERGSMLTRGGQLALLVIGWNTTSGCISAGRQHAHLGTDDLLGRGQ